MHQVVRRVFHHFDFFLNHLALFRNVFGAEKRVLHEVGQDFKRPRQLLVKRFDGKTGGLLRRERVKMSANGVRRPRNLFGRAVRGALENHVLEEVRNPVFLLALVPRARAQPDSDGDGTHGGHGFSDDGEAVR